jgi:Kef-type K+ transport system membrane component KefB
MNPTAIEAHAKLVLLQWMIIIAAAWLVGRLGKKVGQPLAVGEITAGILLGPSALGLIWPADWPILFPRETQQSLQLLGKLGLILMLFQVGMEFDYSHLRSRSKTVIAVSLAGILCPFLCGLAIGPWLHSNFAPDIPQFGFQLILCIALSISALPIMGRILIEMKLERTAIGAMGISAAAIDDVIGWILLALVTAIVTSGFDGWAVVRQVIGVLIFFVVLQKIVGPLLRVAWRRSVEKTSSGQISPSFLTVLLVVLFASCLISNWLGVFAIFGAFLLGVSLHGQRDLVQAWRERFSDFVIVAMVPIFFANTGLNTEIGALSTPVAWLGCAVVMMAAVAGKLGGCYLGGRLTGQPWRDAACVATLMNTRALMGLVAINIGLDLGLLNRELFTMLVIMALLTTAMTGPMLRRFLPKELRQLEAESNRSLPSA